MTYRFDPRRHLNIKERITYWQNETLRLPYEIGEAIKEGDHERATRLEGQLRGALENLQRHRELKKDIDEHNKKLYEWGEP